MSERPSILQVNYLCMLFNSSNHFIFNTTYIFFRICIKSYAETRIGESKLAFDCLDTSCKTEFSMAVLSSVLEPNMFSKMLVRMQNEEIKRAGISDLEECPYCTYAAIIENQDEKVFYCLNPSCLKEHCRFVKKFESQCFT